MGQLRRGVVEAEVHPLILVATHMRPLIVATLRFIQLRMPLLPLKPTGQSRRGVIGHALIEPSALRATKALLVE
jgi:hypothetical protein